MMFETNLAGRLDIDLRIGGPGGKCVIRAEKKHCIRNDRSEIEMRDFIRQKKIKKKEDFKNIDRDRSKTARALKISTKTK